MKGAMRVCSGIVTYNPDIQSLKKGIESIEEQVDYIIIFDNGSSNSNDIDTLIAKYKRIVVIKGLENKGIAYALNRLCSWAKNNDYDYIITLDQDSIATKNLVSGLIKYADKEVAIVSPCIVYKNNEEYSKSAVGLIEEVDWVITSGSLTNLKVWQELQGFDEWLFIDSVDYDYCIRAHRLGYKVIRNYDVSLLHELGNLKCLLIFKKKIYITNHVSWRKYYMARNQVVLKKKLGVGNPFKTIVKYLFKTIFFESDKLNGLKYIIKGTADGVKYNIENNN